jgi:hypothetical protein
MAYRHMMVALALVLAGASSLPAQTTENNPLARVKGLKCTFLVYAAAKWKNGGAQPEIRQAQLSLDIDEIDTDSGTARVTGSTGPVHVTALLTVSSLHFMERSVTGTLNVTTVFASEPGVKTLRAVHARHDYLPMSIPGFVSEPTVSQHYGMCDAAM